MIGLFEHIVKIYITGGLPQNGGWEAQNVAPCLGDRYARGGVVLRGALQYSSNTSNGKLKMADFRV